MLLQRHAVDVHQDSSFLRDIDTQINTLLYNYRVDYQISFKAIDPEIARISKYVVETIVSNLGSSEKEKVAKELRKSTEFKTIQSYITNSVGLKAKRFVYSRMSTATETKVHSFQTKFQALTGLILSFLPAFELFVELSLLWAFYDAWSIYSQSQSGFSLLNHFKGLFYVNLGFITASYVYFVIMSFVILPISKPYTAFILSRFLFPIYFRLMKSVQVLKYVFFKKVCYDGHQLQEILEKEHQKILCNFLVPKACLENLPQLIIAFSFYLSIPLQNNVTESFDYHNLAFLACLKSIITFVMVSRVLTSFQNIQKHHSLGITAFLAITLSNLLFLLSRVSSILFCIIFSPACPDLQWYLYYISSYRTYSTRKAITPVVIEELYNATVSFAPAFLMLVVIFFVPLFWGRTFHCLIQPKLDTQLKLPELWTSTLVNIFCPYIPSIEFKGKNNGRNQKRIKFANYSFHFLVNLLLSTFPLFFYGVHFFSTTLPILDEFCSFVAFIRNFEFPTSFPDHLPTHLLFGHLIFPIVSISSFALGILFQVIYRSLFHPNKSIPDNVIEMITNNNNK